MKPTAPLFLVVCLAVSACATDGGEDRYEAELRDLQADCRARGGILAPTGGQTSQPAVDNVCKITGEPSPATRRPR